MTTNTNVCHPISLSMRGRGGVEGVELTRHTPLEGRGGLGLGCERRVATATGWAAARLRRFSPRGTAAAPVLCGVVVFPMFSPVGCCCCRCPHPTRRRCGDPPLAVAAAAPPPSSSSVLQPRWPMECTGNNSVINKNIAMRDSHAIKWSLGRHLG